MKTKTLIIELQYPAGLPLERIKQLAQDKLKYPLYLLKAPKAHMRVLKTDLRCANCGGGI